MLQAQINDTKFAVGDTVKVKNTIIEGGKSRVQAFEGIVISIHGRAENRSFTVRRIATGQVGVERIWPLNSRSIVDIQVVRGSKNVRRSKLYYIRDVIGRGATRV